VITLLVIFRSVVRIVAPKKAKLQEAEGELRAQMDKLNEKRAQLQQISDKLQALNDEFSAMNEKKKELEDNINLCSLKLQRAEQLIGKDA
jgi:dynein heavy chain